MKKYIFLILYFSLFLYFYFIIIEYGHSSIFQRVLNPTQLSEDIYLFSSFIEQNKIRFIIFSNDKNTSQLNKKLYCGFCGKQKHRSVITVSHYVGVHDKYYNFFCDLPTDSTNIDKVKLLGKRVTVNTLEVKKKYKLVFCLTTMFDYNKTYRFIEFIEYYRNFGVDKFIIYNTNCSKEIEKILLHYYKLGLVEVFYDNFTHNLYEKKRFHVWKQNDCFHRYKNIAKRMIFTDHDEIIYSPLYRNSIEMFSHLPNYVSSFHFYPKLTITKGKGFFSSGNYSICPNMPWKFILNNISCILQIVVHDVITKINCVKEIIPSDVGFVLHARNFPSYHVKKCNKWIYENQYVKEKKLLEFRSKRIAKCLKVL